MSGILSGLIGIVVTILVLGVLVLVHELGHFLTARLSNIRVLEFGIGFPPRAKVLARRGETDYTLNYLPIGGFVKLEGEETPSDDPRAFSNAPLLRQLLVLVAGVVMNVILAFVLFFLVAWVADPAIGAQIGEVTAASPAANAGLQPGDTIVSVDGQRYGWMRSGVIAGLREHAGQTVEIGYLAKDGTSKTVTVTLASPQDVAAGKGALGFRPAALPPVGGYVGTDVVTAGQTAWGQTQSALGLILGGLRDIGAQLVTNPTQPPSDVGGPILIAQQVNTTLWDYGPVFVLILAAILSANLALVNILPFPPLDGGKMVVIVIKRLVGSRGVSALEATTYLVGFALLMAFILWISIFDIQRLGQ